MSPGLRARALAALESSVAKASESRGSRALAIAVELSPDDARHALDDDALMRCFEADEEAAVAGCAEARFALFQPERDRAWFARGECTGLVLPADDEDRMALLPARVRGLFDRVDVVAAEGLAPWVQPQLVGGLGYRAQAPLDPVWRELGAGSMWLPRELWIRRGTRLACIVAMPVPPSLDADRERLSDAIERLCAGAEAALAAPRVDPLNTGDGAIAPEYCAASDRAHSEYCDGVGRATEAIGRGEFEKVVLARSLRVRYANGPRYVCGRLLRTLRAANPSAAIFAVARPCADGSGEAVFLGASPELLARVEDGRIETLALAGSAPRGRSPEEDDRLGRSLVESKKQQSEHRAVVVAIREALRELGIDSECPEAPSLRKLEGIQHLATPIAAALDVVDTSVLRGARSVVDFVARLHPTPAVCGAPREAAEAWIARYEDLERGWYAGPVGVVDARGEGEFHVALRSGIVRGSEARLFAGAGIVEGSEPEAELAETRVKLRTLLAPLTEI